MAKYIIDTDLGTNGGRLRVKDYNQLEEWLSVEEEFLQALGSTQQGKHLLNHFRGLRNLTKQALGSPGDAGVRNQLIREISKYKDRQLLHSTSPHAKLVRQLADDGLITEANGALKASTNGSINAQSYPELHGAVSVALLEEGLSKRSIPTVQASLEELRKKYQTMYADSVERTDALAERLDALVDNHAHINSRAAKATADLIKVERGKAAQQRDDAKRRLSEFEETYNTKLALEAPTQYWISKSRKHEQGIVNMFGLFVLYVVLVFFVAIIQVQNTRLGDLSLWQDASLSVLGLTLAAFSLFVVFARTLLRLVLASYIFSTMQMSE